MANDEDLTNWTPPRWPDADRLDGRYAVLERLDRQRHGAELFRANRESDAIWNYLPYGPFREAPDYDDWIDSVAEGPDPRFYAIRDTESGLCGGVASYLRIKPEAGSIEVGHINLAPRLQRSRGATEAMYLMMRWVFEAGYRRYEWKCNAANLASRRAAQRLGLSYEGIFRQATVVKGRNRDTAWFAAIDSEWPALRMAFDTWLGPENFFADGRQRRSLSGLTAPILHMRDPGLG